MVLGNSFPDSEKEKSFQNQFKPGVVLYLPCDFTKPPKPKYLLLAAEDGDALFFVINSEINPFLRGRPDTLRSQVLLKQEEHGFLDHDSYINCCELKKINKENIRQMVVDDMARIKGRLSNIAIEDVLQAVEASRTLPNKEKRLVLSALRG